MLHEILTSSYTEVIRRCGEKSDQRFEPGGVRAAVNHGVPLFLQQLVETLRFEASSRGHAEPGSETTPAHTAIGRAAALHGAELLRLGYSVDQVVHEYGDVCQSITAMAVESNQIISADEFRTLNRCLDDAIADAVTSYGDARQISLDGLSRTSSDRMGAFLDEHRRLVDIASHACAAIRTGNVGLLGATGTLLVHTLAELRSLADRTLSEFLPGRTAGTAPTPMSYPDF
jgi:hypothetical protein